VGPNNSIRVVAKPYHIVLTTTKTTKNTAIILLDSPYVILYIIVGGDEHWGVINLLI
jgi:hypothetical protein